MPQGPEPKTAGTLPAANVGTWLGLLASAGRVLAPLEVDGRPLFREAGPEDAARLDLEATRAIDSPKGGLLPQTEALLRYVRSKGEDGRPALALTPVRPGGPAVLFGVRPCDAVAFELLDKVFLEGDFVDDQYRARREGATVVAVACPSPRRNCFCTSFGLSPGDVRGADVVLYGRSGPGRAVETDAYYALAYTGRGEALLRGPAAREAGLAELPPGEAPRMEETAASFRNQAVPLGSRLGRIDVAGKLEGLFESPYWERIARRCLACGTCTFVCPTCYCFGVADSGGLGAGVRYRYWDACKFPEFLQMAAGHNPRPAKKHRTRQRFMHKLAYFPRRYGEYLCVGCGRCVDVCPVGLHLPLVVHDVRGLEG